ncbi:MAG: replicative DNA helicase, partial [Candidatus Methylomirabilis sp.]|nr:replicative DNA helicase [Deltaproteobacteria bacterium]
LMTLAETTPTTANVRSYAAIVREKSVLRRLLEAGGEIVRKVHSQGADAQTLLDDAERSIFEVSGDNSRDAFTPIKDIVTATFRQITELFENPDRYTGLPSGFHHLDEMTGGLQPSDLVIVAARPSMGKTAFCLSLARHAALAERPGKVLVFSLEMSKEQLVKRLLCADGKIDATRLNRGRLGESDWPRLTRSAARVSEAPIFIDDTPAITVVELRAKARRLAKREGGLAMIVVDYLQLMRGSSDAETRTLEVGEISRGLKALAKELHVPVVALSQLNRSVEQRPGKRPQLSDLRESGAIEQDADLILFIFREEVYLRQAKEDVPEDVLGMAEIIIGK